MKRGNKKPYFSVIIPAKNEEKLLPGCLESIEAQDTHLPWELIVVDSSSDPLSRSIAKDHGATVIHEERLGIGTASQTGANMAKGEIFCFTDADCRLPPDWLTTVADQYRLHPDAAAFTSTYTYFNSTFWWKLLARIVLPITVWGFFLFFGNHSIRGLNMAIPRSKYFQSGGFNPDAKELPDVELGLRLARLGRIYFVPKMSIQTSDRRIRNRLKKEIKESFPTIFQLLVLKKIPEKETYEDIR